MDSVRRSTFFLLSPDLPPAQQLTRRLIAYGRALGASGPYFAQPAAAALDRLYLDLARWVGFDGCHALFMRALAEAKVDHPLLEAIELQPRATPYLAGVAETVEKHGALETDQALQAMLVILIEVLGRLIGDEMATNLIERGLPQSADDTSRESRRAEA
jgi:hypothetical protein